MFLVREVLNCKPGKVGALKDKFKELGTVMTDMGLEPFTLMTDVAGASFWTLVLERKFASLDEVTALEAKVMSNEKAQGVMAGYHDLVVSGSREIYKLEN